MQLVEILSGFFAGFYGYTSPDVEWIVVEYMGRARYISITSVQYRIVE